ncbi:MAG: hypothetical protein F6K31_11495 [Symploca sp. SIO2G7]|nr:hypothetical protein [Symploca sp. SIO2G7]
MIWLRLLQASKPVPLEIIPQETILMWNWHLASHLNHDLAEITTGTEAFSTVDYSTRGYSNVELASCQSSKS